MPSSEKDCPGQTQPFPLPPHHYQPTSAPAVHRGTQASLLCCEEAEWQGLGTHHSAALSSVPMWLWRGESALCQLVTITSSATIPITCSMVAAAAFVFTQSQHSPHSVVDRPARVQIFLRLMKGVKTQSFKVYSKKNKGFETCNFVCFLSFLS